MLMFPHDSPAIMPYYVSLFLLNDNTITTSPEQASQLHRAVEQEDDGSSVEGILQVMASPVV